MLRHRWADGTTHLRFDPLELLERLAVLTPRPRVNLILYYGVLAPPGGPRWSRSSQTRSMPSDAEVSGELDGNASRAPALRAGAYQWAELIGRTVGVDVLAC